MNAHIFYHPRRIRVVRISVSCFLYAPVLAALCFQLVCPAVPLSVLVSVPSSNGLLTALAVCQPRRTCGWDHSCANVNSPAGGGVYSVQKWNSPQGGQVHYADAVAGGIKWPRAVFISIVYITQPMAYTAVRCCSTSRDYKVVFQQRSTDI